MSEQVGVSIRAAYNTFALWVANGTVGYPLLEATDYSDLLSSEPSCLRTVFAIFGNNLRLGERGEVLNFKEAEHRAALYLYCYCNGWDRWPDDEARFTDDELDEHFI